MESDISQLENIQIYIKVCEHMDQFSFPTKIRMPYAMETTQEYTIAIYPHGRDVKGHSKQRRKIYRFKKMLKNTIKLSKGNKFSLEIKGKKLKFSIKN